MSLSPNEILDLIEKAKSLGLQSIEVEGVKATFSGVEIGNAVSRHVPEMSHDQLIISESPFEQLTDEEVLYWSTPYYDEIQAMKEEKKNRIQNEKVEE